MSKKKQSTKEQVWRGEETRPGVQGSETPEEAASRAEGNAPIRVEKRIAAAEEHAEQPRHGFHGKI